VWHEVMVRLATLVQALEILTRVDAIQPLSSHQYQHEPLVAPPPPIPKHDPYPRARSYAPTTQSREDDGEEEDDRPQPYVEFGVAEHIQVH
jgi:hypothetical protein